MDKLYMLNTENLALVDSPSHEEIELSLTEKWQSLFRTFLSVSTTMVLDVRKREAFQKQLKLHLGAYRLEHRWQRKDAYIMQLVLPLNEAVRHFVEMFLTKDHTNFYTTDFLDEQDNLLIQSYDFGKSVLIYTRSIQIETLLFDTVALSDLMKLESIDDVQMNIEVYEGTLDLASSHLEIEGEVPVVFSVNSSGTDDYVEATKLLLIEAADKLYSYPMYIHFEANEDAVEDLLEQFSKDRLTHQPTNRTVLTMYNGKTYQAPVPSFSLRVDDFKLLQSFLGELMYLPMQNDFMMISENHKLDYNKGYPFVEMTTESLIMKVDYDAQGIIFCSTRSDLQKHKDFKSLFKNVMIIEATSWKD